MEETIEYLNKRIGFLESLLKVNMSTLNNAMTINRMLLEELKKRAK